VSIETMNFIFYQKKKESYINMTGTGCINSYTKYSYEKITT